MAPSTDEEEAKMGCCSKFNLWWKKKKLVIWNGETKEFIGRNAYCWGTILLFYVCYFLFTGGYFAVCFAIFMRTIDDRAPTFQKYYSILKFNPGMTFLPMAHEFYVYVNSSNEKSYSNHLQQLRQELENHANATSLKICDKQSNSTFDEACRFNISTLGKECSMDKMFGYPNGTPCFFMKINNIYGWDPEIMKPGEISCHGKDDNSNECYFMKLPDRLKSSVNPDYIPISCEGLNSLDMDNLLEVKFYPQYGFPIHFYPYYNQPGFLPPIVAAKVKVRRGVQVTIQCKIWTRNIKHDLDDRQGSLRLELMVDGRVDFASDSFDNSSAQITMTSSTAENDVITTSSNQYSPPTLLPVEQIQLTTVTSGVNEQKTT